MRIKEIHIYGYGKMKDQSFTNLQDFQLFYGRNEAGKSTVMSFIHSILFGFPTKVQNENRYEPKEHSVYGGKLVLLTEKDGEVTVQRLKGKASGDVTVTYSDGRVGAEEDLKEILQGMDKATYQSIFSFDLNGLSELQKLSEHEVSRFMLSAGLLGNDDLLKTEQYLQKEMEANFKPSGKLPKINQLLSETQSSYESLTQAGREQDLYEQYKEEYNRFSEEKAQTENRLKELAEELKVSSNYLTAEPLLLEETRLQQKLSEMNDVFVPADAQEQFQLLKKALLPIEASVNSAHMRKKQLEDKLKDLHVDEAIWLNQEAVQSAIDKSVRAESLHYELQALQQQKRQNEEQILRLKDEMNLHLSDEEILRLDHSAMKKETILRLESTAKKLEHEKESLDKKQEEAQLTLQAIKQKIRDLKSRKLSEEDKSVFEKQVDHYSHANSANMQLELINQSISSLTMQVKKGEEKAALSRKRSNKLFTILLAVLVICSVVFFLMKELLVAGVILVAGILIFLLKGMFTQPSLIDDLKEQLKDLEGKREELAKDVGPVSKEAFKHATVLLDQDYEIDQLLQNEAIKQSEHEALFYRTIDEFEKWEREMAALEHEKEQLLSDWHLEGRHISTSMLPYMYDAISQLKSYLYEKKHIIEKWEAINHEKTAIETALIDYCKQYTNKSAETYAEAAVLLKRYLEEATKVKLQQDEWREAVSHLEDELSELQLQAEHYQKQIQSLFEAASSKDEADFLLTLQQANEKQGYEEKLEIIKLQLVPYEKERKAWEQKDTVINSYSISMLEEEKISCEQQLIQLEEQLADRRLRIQQLEEAGTFDDRSFHYYAKKSELEEQAKEWMTLSLAKNMLSKAVNSYKNEKFPEILQKAEKYVYEITNGEYIRLYWKEEDAGLMLQRKDGIVFEAKEVSRGTQEGIYTALRLSLAGHVFANHDMPIIIDDSFVNFDRSRVETVIKILKSIQKQQQIIFFTCHDYLLPYFEEKQIVHLSGRKLTL